MAAPRVPPMCEGLLHAPRPAPATTAGLPGVLLGPQGFRLRSPTPSTSWAPAVQPRPTPQVFEPLPRERRQRDRGHRPVAAQLFRGV